MVPKVLEFYETRHCISVVKWSEERANYWISQLLLRGFSAAAET
jgi:hypothetical protein